MSSIASASSSSALMKVRGSLVAGNKYIGGSFNNDHDDEDEDGLGTGVSRGGGVGGGLPVSRTLNSNKNYN